MGVGWVWAKTDWIFETPAKNLPDSISDDTALG